MSDLRERIAETLRSTPRALNAAYWDPDIDHHGKHENGSTAWCALCCRDVDALVAALLSVVQDQKRDAWAEGWMANYAVNVHGDMAVADIGNPYRGAAS